jgi:translation initiation factor IF-3
MGILKIEEALARARSHFLDLVEVAPNVTPPVCKIIDFGKYKFQQAKLARESRKHHHGGKVKEIKFRPNIAPHDRLTKLRNAEVFLDKGMKVKLTLMFRGREMVQIDSGPALMRAVCEELNHVGQVEGDPKRVGARVIVAMMAPLPQQKRVRKYSQPHEEAVEEPEEDHDESEE